MGAPPVTVHAPGWCQRASGITAVGGAAVGGGRRSTRSSVARLAARITVRAAGRGRGAELGPHKQRCRRSAEVARCAVAAGRCPLTMAFAPLDASPIPNPRIPGGCGVEEGEEEGVGRGRVHGHDCHHPLAGRMRTRTAAASMGTHAMWAGHHVPAAHTRTQQRQSGAQHPATNPKPAARHPHAGRGRGTDLARRAAC